MSTPHRRWSLHLRRAALWLLVGLGPAAAHGADAPVPAAPEKKAPAAAKKKRRGARSAPAPAADPGPDETDLFALDAQLEQQTQVASSRAQSVETSPAIVTLVEREEILRSGARDLMDVLYLVPGFFFGVDVQGVVGVGFRGHWANEGKVLMLVDGQEVNEGLYSTLQLGNRMPVEQIQRVEVLRGPGSAQYGGNAELAVINVITRGPEQLQGGAASLTYGQQQGGYARRNLSLSLGHVFEAVEGLSASVSGYFGEAQRSARDYAAGVGAPVPLAGENRLSPRQLNVGVRYRDLQLRFLYDDYRTTSRDGFGEAFAERLPVDFRALHGEARHELALGEQLTLTTRLNVTRQDPWRVAQPGDAHYDKHFSRLRGRVLLGYAPLAQLHLDVGLDASVDRAALDDVQDLSGLQTLFGEATSVRYGNLAATAEAQLDTALVNVVAGARLEHHSLVGTSFVPRLVLTKQLERFYAKALASRAFRAPAIEHINTAPGIRPERTTVLELEAGYLPRDGMSVSANAYDITIGQPIVYFFDPEAGVEGYRNFERSGTRGLELEYALDGGWGRAQLRYSLYSAAGKQKTPAYQTPDAGTLLGLPNHRVSLGGHVNLPWALTLAPTLHLFGPRTGLDGVDAAGAARYGREPVQLLVNLFLQRQDAFVRGLDLGVGLYNALGADFRFLQPYDGGHAPLPGHDRELLVRASYTLPL